ncbi:MAG: class I SAM-dependent methyltransferase [Kiloniellales bacterium]|nr:class I SAM-dependent methyltransferase [Kiloniellales bacterium]
MPILEILSAVLPADGRVLEVASGTGEHAAYFAPRLVPRLWQPSDPDRELRRSIAAHARQAACTNLEPPLALDARDAAWPVTEAAAVVCINMIHIAPWAAAEGLVAGAGRLLAPGGVLYLYGPFRRDGRHTAPSNAAFDRSLRAQDPAWGVRDLGAVAALAAAAGFGPAEAIEMPANNLSVVFRRL